jgi:NAD(P)H-dependent FMN reductase
LIGDADAVIICTPEYVFSLPGVLKNALEWTVSTMVFSYKPFAFIVASASGEKAFESLDLVMKTLLQVPIEDSRKLLIRGGRGKVNEAGEFADETTVKEIERVMEALINQIG